MKKILSLVLAAALTLSLAACGNKTDNKGDQPAAPASEPAIAIDSTMFRLSLMPA